MKNILVVLLIVIGIDTLMAGPSGLLVKGAFKTYDEIAKICLKISGREASQTTVSSAAKTLSTVAAKYGDDVARFSMKGGIEVAEQALRHGDDFIALLRRCADISPKAIRLVATNPDDLLRLTSKYGDDVLRVGAKLPGEIKPLVQTLEANHLPVKETLRALNGIDDSNLPRVIGALQRAKSPSVAKDFMKAVERNGNQFIDRFFKLNGTQIFATGLSAAMITAAVQGIEPSNAKTIEWAQQILANPDATPEEKKLAEQILESSTEPLTVKLLKGPIWVFALLLGATICVILFCRFSKRSRSKDTGRAIPKQSSIQRIVSGKNKAWEEV